MDKKQIRAATKEFTYGLLGMIGGAWALGWLWSTYQWRSGKIGEAAQFGDSFGGLNSLLTGLGFVLVALSLFKQHVDSVKAEELRREDKKEEDARRLETEERHNEGIAAQERIALIQASSTLLNVKRDRLKSLERDYREVKELGRRFSIWCGKQDETPQYHPLTFKVLLSNSSSRGDEELRSMIAAILGARVLEFSYSAKRDALKEKIAKRLLNIGDARLINRTQVTALEKKLEEISGFAATPKEPEESAA